MTDKFWHSKNIAARFDCIELLGTGHIGSVYRARDKVLDKEIAIKVLRENLTPEQCMRFQQEAKLSGRLKHENIVGVFDFGVTENNRPYLVMEFLEGKSLEEILTSSQSIELPLALEIFIQICSAMSHSHANKILHRDLKPTNIILLAEHDPPLIKIVDFGLARLKDRDDRLTPTRRGVGSPLYMAPEQADALRVDERSDIYSMGCVMYEVLGGKPPFTGQSPLETLLLHKTKEPQSLVEAIGIPEMGPPLDGMVRKCLAKDPADRYQSFVDLQADLEDLSQAFFGAKIEAADIEANDQSEPLFKVPSIELESTADRSVPTPRSFNPKMVIPFLACAMLLLVIVGLTIYRGEVSPRSSQSEQADFHFPTYQKQEHERGWLEAKFKVDEFENGIHVKQRIGLLEDGDLAPLQRFKEIHDLSLVRSLVTGTGFDALKNVSIDTVQLTSAPVTDEGLKHIARIKGLRALFLEDMRLVTDRGLAELSASPSLFHIRLSGLHLSEKSLETLQKIKPLSQVVLRNMHITGKGIENLRGIAILSYIQLIRCDITDDALRALSRLPNLKYLVFSEMKLTDRQIAIIQKIPVESLQFLETAVDRSGLMKLAGNKNVGALVVICRDASPQDIKWLATRFSKLEKLRVSRGENAGETNKVRAASELQLEDVMTEVKQGGLPKNWQE